MKNRLFFPSVITTKIETDQYRAEAVIRVRSILSPMLRKEDNLAEEQGMIKNFRHHVALLQALAGWPGDTTLALNIFTRPDRRCPMGGRLKTGLVVSVISTEAAKAVASALGRHAALISLLQNYFPEIEFAAVTDEKEAAAFIHPFIPTVIRGIGRRRETFTVLHPRNVTDVGRRPRAIGFLTTGDQAVTAWDNAELPYCFPWTNCDPNQGDLSTFAEVLLANPVPLLFQVRLQPSVSGREILEKKRRALLGCEDILSEMRHDTSICSVQLRELRDALTERLQELSDRHLFRAGAFLCSSAEIDEAITHGIAAIIAPRQSAAQEARISLYGNHQVHDIIPENFADPGWFFEDEPFTAGEAAAMFRLPYPSQPDTPGLPLRAFRTGFADPAILRQAETGGLLLGDNVHRGIHSEIRQDIEDRMRHTILFGQTGSGKSTLMANMVVQDINKGHGLCLIDPHGDLVTDVLHRFPEHRRDDLVLVDLLDTSQVMPMNILAWRSADERDLMIDTLYTWLDQAYNMRDTGGPMFELYFRCFLRVVMGDTPRTDFVPTIADFNRMFMDDDFRKFCIAGIEDEQVLHMMKQARRASGEARLDNIAPYITSKLNRFVMDQNMKRMVGQEEMIIDFDAVMNNSRVMLVNLGKGRYGEVISSLVAGQLVSRFKAAAMKRIFIPAEQRRDFFLYVDEFQNIASDDFVSMLSEARKYRLGLILANQFADQLDTSMIPGKPSVLQALLGNVGTMINFRLGIRDAETLESVFFPEFNRFDLINLPMGHCYINLKRGGSRPMPISMQTRYRETRTRPDHVAELRRRSNEKYAISVDQADKNIKERNAKIDDLIEGSDSDMNPMEMLRNMSSDC